MTPPPVLSRHLSRVVAAAVPDGVAWAVGADVEERAFVVHLRRSSDGRRATIRFGVDGLLGIADDPWRLLDAVATRIKDEVRRTWMDEQPGDDAA